MKKIFIFILIFIYSNSLYSKGLQKVSLQLLWKHQFEFAGYYVAKEKGFYKAVGLDVDIKEYEFGTNTAADVSNGKTDFGVDSSALILDKINGLDVYLLAATLQTSPFVLMSKKREDLKTVADLKGKKIMLTPNQVTMASLNAMFKVNNISKNDFIEQQHSFNVQDLIDGKTDAMAVYLSNEPYYMIEKGLKYNIFNPSDFGFNLYDNILFTSKKLATKNPKLVDDFYEASQKGWDYAFNNIEETAQLVFDKYNTQNKSLEHCIYEANELKKLSHFGSNEYGKFKPEIVSQIVQTYNLLDISKSKIDFKEIIYPKAIYKERSINYQLLWKILIAIVLLFIGFYYWNRKLAGLNKEIEKSKSKIKILLDNAGQGFLTFNDKFVVDGEYSKECEKLIGEDIASKNISTLLFSNEIKQEFFKNTLLNALNEPMKIKRDSYLSLLPKIILLNKKAVKLEYKILEDGNFMLILTNITSQKKLENKIKKEQEIFKMIVAIVSETQTFYDTKEEYQSFIKLVENSDILFDNISDIYRTIHTFKGSFSQLYMDDIVKVLHELEGKISYLSKNKTANNEDLLNLLLSTDFHTSLDKTLDIIEDILGEEFLNEHNFLKIDLSNIQMLQEKISKVLTHKGMASVECQDILCQVQNLSKIKLCSLLKPYTSLVSQLAIRLNKDIYELSIDGNRELNVSEKIKPFIKSLIHVFRNSIDHGIEIADVRVEKDKDEKGMIACEFKVVDNNLKITILDDGAGIDVDKIKEKLINQSIDISNLNEQELYNYIFEEQFSTKDDTTDISGRGIGMSAVKYELDKLNGEVKITSKKDIGTTIEFTIPLND